MLHANDNPTPVDGEPITFISMFSGIEAASVAFGPLGWKAVVFAEIEKFPSAVLAHHYPDVPNVGDMTAHDWSQYHHQVDIVCGGPPCQAFSVAGLRNSMQDARGNLSLSYMRALHAIDPRNAIVENVPGWLNTPDNAFGCFLAGIVGADDALLPSPKPDDGKSDAHWKWSKQKGRHTLSWPTAGLVSGPQGRAAWRIQDAQFHGLAQRRRRVLLVADFGRGADPAAVLFELVGMQGNPAPSREARKDIAPTISARTKGGGGLGTDFDLDGGLDESAMPLGYAPEIARCDATREGSSQDYETTTMVAVEVAPTMRAGGNSTGGDRPYGTDVDTCDSLAVVHAIQAGALRTNPASGPDGVGVQEGISYTLEARSEVQAVVYSLMPQNSGKDFKARIVDVAQPIMAGGPVSGNQGGDVIVDPLAFDTTQITSAANRSNPQPGDPCHPLSAQAHPPAIAFQSSQSGVRVGEVHATLDSNNGSRRHNGAVVGSAVRRLTPTECERLQGFPDGYTDIPWRGKPTSPDGPRYKALGNSWAVPKFTWLGRRIQKFMPKREALRNAA